MKPDRLLFSYPALLQRRGFLYFLVKKRSFAYFSEQPNGVYEIPEKIRSLFMPKCWYVSLFFYIAGDSGC